MNKKRTFSLVVLERKYFAKNDTYLTPKGLQKTLFKAIGTI